MFTIQGPKQTQGGISRRSFLKVGAFGSALTLADMLRCQASAGALPVPSPRRFKSAIMIWLHGGPPHMDMWDLKPDAPVEFRGKFRPINTNVPGVHICELLPLQARMWNKLACIRSVVSVNEHSDALIFTGRSRAANRIVPYPSIGAVVSRVRADEGPVVPQFVNLRRDNTNPEGSFGDVPAHLGNAHRPFTPTGPAADNLRPLANVDENRMHRRQTLLEGFDGLRRDIDANITSLDTFTARAFEMIATSKVRMALDVSREPERIRERYRGCEELLIARRMAEAGAGLVTLSLASPAWDTHTGNFTKMRDLLPLLDRCVCSLVEDLHARGLNDDVLTVVWGEFGRTPRINNARGRDHWPQVMSVLIAGGGLRMGQMIGASTARGEYPADRPCKVTDILATVYRVLGIDTRHTFPSAVGRPIHILDDGEPVRELMP